ncbi:hypothetical protein [Allocoleopsis sp.]|uniref:hypothetical protein n=1 Tax=Allocoleopsis sp. TaxID=3088169 RepID=UPI002FD55BCA
MFTHPPTQDSSRSMLDIAPFQQMIVELDEKSEESLSAGTINKSGIKYSVIVKFGFHATKRS